MTPAGGSGSGLPAQGADPPSHCGHGRLTPGPAIEDSQQRPVPLNPLLGEQVQPVGERLTICGSQPFTGQFSDESLCWRAAWFDPVAQGLLAEGLQPRHVHG